MPSVYDLKSRFQGLLRPLMKLLAKLGVKPNGLTLAALAGSAVVGVAVLTAFEDPRWLLLLPAWLFLRMALNALDGMMARECAMATPLGAVLNELGDVLSDLALYLPLCVAAPRALVLILAFSILAALTEFCGVLAQALRGVRRYDGPMGKSDRAFIVGLAALVAALAPSTLAYWPWVFFAASLLEVWTCGNRLRGALAPRGELAP